MKDFIVYVPIAMAVLGLVFMLIKAAWVNKQPAGDEKMQSISKSIQEGALAFLAAEYRILGVFVLIASAALFAVSQIVATSHWMIVVAFVFGAFLLAGLAVFLATFVLAADLVALAVLAFFWPLGVPFFWLAALFVLACSGAVVAPCSATAADSLVVASAVASIVFIVLIPFWRLVVRA